MGKVKQLNLFVLIMLIVSAIDSIRNMPATALFGSSLIFFFILAAILFLLPTSLIAAELTSALPEHNGVYDWVKTAMGGKWAFIVIWFQWINTVFWYPTLLSFMAGVLAYLVNPDLVNNKFYLVSVILIVFWALTLLNLKGLEVSAKFTTVCSVFGLVIPLMLIIGLAIAWVVSGQPLQVHFTEAHLLPHLGQGQSWVSLTAIIASFLGMELAMVHVKNIKNPQRQVPKAMLFAIAFIVVTMFLGAMAIAFVVPVHQINLVDGVMQAFSAFFNRYHMHWFLPVLAIMIFIGSLSEMISWMISPAKGLLIAGENGYLPKALCKINKHGVANRILIMQAILVSVVALVFLLMPSVSSSYWLLTDLSTQLYVMMYVLMFVAAILLLLKNKITITKRAIIPGKKPGIILVCLAGISGCLITLAVGFIPPANIAVGGFWHYEIMFLIGMGVMLLPSSLFFIYKKISST